MCNRSGDRIVQEKSCRSKERMNCWSASRECWEIANVAWGKGKRRGTISNAKNL